MEALETHLRSLEGHKKGAKYVHLRIYTVNTDIVHIIPVARFVSVKVKSS